MLQKIKECKYTPYIIIVVLGILICIPYCTQDLINNNEFRLHVIRISAVKELIGDGFFPPLISYKYMLGFGYGVNIFYGIICTYVPILISLITGSVFQAIKIYTVLCVIISGITMYLFVFKITKSKKISLLASIIYMFMPYKLSNIYSRHAIGEYTAFIFIPTFFKGLYCCLNSEKKSVLYLTIGACGLILSHTITLIYSIIFGIIYVLVNFNKIKNIIFWKNILKSILLSLLLTSFYTIPIIEHRFAANYVIFNEDIMNTSGAYVLKNTNIISDWFKLSLSYNGDIDFSIGIPALVLIVITLFSFNKIEAKYKKIYWTFFCLGILSLFMCTFFFPWKQMPNILTTIQFAWRLNGFFIFFISFVCSINAYYFSKAFKKKDSAIYIIILMLCSWIPIVSTIGQIKNYGNNQSKEFEAALSTNTKPGVYNIVRDYMPERTYKIKDNLNNRPDKTIITSGNAQIISEDKYKLNDKIQIEVNDESYLELPYLYYLGYTTKLNGKPIQNYESENGFISVKVSESGTLELNYEGTVLERMAYAISLSTYIIIIVYLIEKRIRKEHI